MTANIEPQDHLVSHSEAIAALEMLGATELVAGQIPLATDQLDPLLLLIALDNRHTADEQIRWAAAVQESRRLSETDVLSFSVLGEIHSLLGAGPSIFRSATAVAKGGKERYGYYGGLDADFARRMDHNRLRLTNTVSYSAVTYLDVCFFHPFADGNGRMALIAADFILHQQGLSLEGFEFVRPIPAGSGTAYNRFTEEFRKAIRRIA